MSEQACNVAVLGGGPAGCATALALARRGIGDIVVVEAGDYAGLRIGESLPPDTGLLLRSLGVWDDFLAEGHEPCLGSCSAWGTAELGYNDFLFNPHGSGWHLDRRRFDAWLARKTVESGARVITGASFESSEPLTSGFRLGLNGGTVLTARFVVDATGKRARFAQQQGAQRRLLDQLTFVAGFFDLPADATRLTTLEAAEEGWWYAARLPDHRLVVTLASDPDILRAAGLDQVEGWSAALARTRHVGPLTQGVPLDAGGLSLWPGVTFLLDGAAGADWLAVGDAASGYDPLSSQGIHKALVDAHDAAETIAARLRDGIDGAATYRAKVAARFADYLRNRNYFYGLEQRWPESRFWCRRHQRTDVVAPQTRSLQPAPAAPPA